jgi:hypothetical protein
MWQTGSRISGAFEVRVISPPQSVRLLRVRNRSSKGADAEDGKTLQGLGKLPESYSG